MLVTTYKYIDLAQLGPQRSFFIPRHEKLRGASVEHDGTAEKTLSNLCDQRGLSVKIWSVILIPTPSLTKRTD